MTEQNSSRPLPEYLINRICPSCDGNPADSAFIQAPRPGERLNFEEIGRAWRGLFQDRPFFSYFRCATCGQLFAPVYLSDSALHALYKEMGDNVHSGDEMLSRLTQYEYCSLASRYLESAKTYCEIGPDIGHFLQAARSQYSIEDVLLIEPNQSVWPSLREAADGVKMEIVSPEDAKIHTIADGSLDLIVAIHVLDHLPVPSETLKWTAQKLAPKGIAVFVVHNEKSLLSSVLGRRWPPYCMQHPQLYNPASLAKAIEGSGMLVCEVLRTANQFPLGYLVTHGLYTVTKRQYSLDRLSLPIRLKLGNIMAVASRR